MKIPLCLCNYSSLKDLVKGLLPACRSIGLYGEVLPQKWGPHEVNDISHVLISKLCLVLLKKFLLSNSLIYLNTHFCPTQAVK